MTAVKKQDREVEHERRGVLNATTIFLVACVTTPAACVSCTGSRKHSGIPEPSRKGNAMGSGRREFVPKPEGFRDCG